MLDIGSSGPNEARLAGPKPVRVSGLFTAHAPRLGGSILATRGGMRRRLHSENGRSYIHSTCTKGRSFEFMNMLLLVGRFSGPDHFKDLWIEVIV